MPPNHRAAFFLGFSYIRKKEKESTEVYFSAVAPDCYGYSCRNPFQSYVCRAGTNVADSMQRIVSIYYSFDFNFIFPEAYPDIR